ncbi:helix-turn-helix domain-containing protein [Rhodococcus sp. G-MC3]|uniref:PucR family transcriptional regulator n=1 Tax=Rhodococcus sp. G-MC3 TaxID=3046209 RepID=UPI0024BB82EF|nr:helix-turn-helix domain-containing protein [Rhodococcus sp. G-MC3]MDJ0393662.1 helix-turn-helix domain-containing protein [Rhodococcus sp. G-MC3]
MATTVVTQRSVETLSLGGRPASHHLRTARDTTARLVEHVLTTTECRDLTDAGGRSAVAEITERCVALAADVLDSGCQPCVSDLSRLKHAATKWARKGVPLAPIQHAFHEGFSVGLRMVAGRAVDGEHAALVDGAVLMFGLLDAVSEAVSSAYLDEYRAVASQHHELAHAMVTALLAGDPDGAGIAERIGLKPASGYEVVAVHFPQHPTEDADFSLQRIHAAVTHFFAPDAPLAILSTSGGTILVPDPTATSVEELVAALSSAAGQQISASAVMSLPERIPDAADNAYELLRLAQRLNYQPAVYRIADLALEFQIARPGVGQRHLQRLLDPLRRIPDLLPTLEAFVHTEANRKKAAKQLVVHPNTVDYRLKRIEQITGIDPMKSSGLRSLHAALIADHLDPKRSA